jgi:SH3-like domain-containing protein
MAELPFVGTATRHAPSIGTNIANFDGQNVSWHGPLDINGTRHWIQERVIEVERSMLREGNTSGKTIESFDMNEIARLHC